MAQGVKRKGSTKLRDAFWVWGHEAGSHNGEWLGGRGSRMTPAEGALYLGVPNVLMVAFAGKPEPPFEQYGKSLAPFDRLVWSIVGDSSSTRNDAQPDMEPVLQLARTQENLVGAIMDDFFHEPKADGSVSRFSLEQIRGFRERLHAAARPLDLWVVLYAHQLHLPVAEHLAACDVVTFWTWEAKDLPRLEENFARFEALAPKSRKVLGCYLLDYGSKKEMPVEAMRMQCELGRKWLREGRIEGMIFLASCVCDLGLPAVEWTRGWVAEVGGERM